MTVLETLLLYLGGLSFFEALTHTFGTVATGGFSPLNGSVGQYNSVYVDVVITIFMFIAGANFALHYKLLMKKDLTAWWRDEEFRFYLYIVFWVDSNHFFRVAKKSDLQQPCRAEYVHLS